MTTFSFRAIDATTLSRLRDRDDAGEAPVPVVGDGEPLRCCLSRAQPGAAIALVSYAPLRRWAAATGATPGPYLERGPVFIHAQECAGPPEQGIDAAMRGTRRVCRAYDRNGRIRDGMLVDARHPDAADSIEEALTKLFAEPETALVHIRAVEYGCFMFEAHRTG